MIGYPQDLPAAEWEQAAAWLDAEVRWYIDSGEPETEEEETEQAERCDRAEQLGQWLFRLDDFAAAKCIERMFNDPRIPAYRDAAIGFCILDAVHFHEDHPSPGFNSEGRFVNVACFSWWDESCWCHTVPGGYPDCRARRHERIEP